MRKSICCAALLALCLSLLSPVFAGEFLASPAAPGTADIVAGADATPTAPVQPAPVVVQTDATGDLTGFPMIQQNAFQPGAPVIVTGQVAVPAQTAYTQEQYAQQLLLQQQMQQQVQQQMAQQQLMLRQTPQVLQFPGDQIVPAQVPQVQARVQAPTQQQPAPAQAFVLPPIESLQTLTPMVVPIQPNDPSRPAQVIHPPRESVQVGVPVQVVQQPVAQPMIPVMSPEAVPAPAAIAIAPAQPMPPIGYAAAMGVPVTGRENLFIISPAQVRQALSQGVQLIILDVRDDLVRDIEGHIEGDAHVAFGPAVTFALRVSRVIPNAAYPIVVYCSDGIWSSHAADIMSRMGYRVYLMGAYPHWLRG